MRLEPALLKKITGLTRKSAQVAWFRQHLGADVPHDKSGVIITDSAYEKLLEKRLGLEPSSSATAKIKPTLRLLDKKAA